MVLPKLSVAVGLLPLLGAVEAYSAAARSARRTTLLERAGDLLPEYDYIVVGGGTSGLTVADRLSESGQCKFAVSRILTTSNADETQTRCLCSSRASIVSLPCPLGLSRD